ncbi:MAG: glycosyltransferase family 2 protein [Rikenellaceae bacterium]
MDVSVIIVNYNTISLLVNCINSIYEKSKGLDLEIIVVDNNSSDDSRQILKDKFTDVNYLSLPENIGFGRANNEGVKIAKGRNIFFLNPDTILLNNAVKILSNELDKNSDYGVVGGNLYNEKGRPCHSHMMYFPGILTELNTLSSGIIRRLFLSKNIEHNYTDSKIEVAYITGADLMMPKDLFIKLGGFNPLFFMYYEETELCFRVKKNGCKIINIPTSKIAHLEGASFSSKISLARFERFHRGREIYNRLTQSKFKKQILNIIKILSLYKELVFSIFKFDTAMFKHQKSKLNIFNKIKRTDLESLARNIISNDTIQ